ncbi:MAG: ribonuclease Y [Clostridiales bacterium]|nr:ribonuclease Y [Clostridiales bacterium]
MVNISILSASIFSVGIGPILAWLGIGLAAGITSGAILMKIVLESKLKKAKSTASKIIENAYSEAKNISKEAILEAKEETHRLKTETDQEVRERRLEVQKLEEKIYAKEEFLNKKEEQLDIKSENLEQGKKEIEEKLKDLDVTKKELELSKLSITKELEKVSNLSKEEAKNMLINSLTEEAKKSAAKTVRDIEEEAKETANKKAQNLIAMAIQRCAADHTSEVTVTSVTLPNEEIKGRIIGREGRNIKALENATGVDLIIDDTPENIVLSGFDPVRREVARLSLEKLMMDGRIHPTRIEEVVEKVKRDIDQTIKEAGENAVFEADVNGLHPEIVKTLGRLKYRTSYGQNVLKHSQEVCYIAGLLAAEIGADIKLAKRGGLLHDLGKAIDHETEGTHVSIGVNLARKYKENENVINCIEAHHGDVEFKCIEAVLVQAADAISSSRPGARRESIENYIKRLEQLETIADSFKGVDKSYAISAGREVRVIVKPEEITDDEAMFLAKDIAKKIEEEMEYPGQIKVNVIRENRAIEYAK